MSQYTPLKDVQTGNTFAWGRQLVYAVPQPKKETEKAYLIEVAFISDSPVGASYEVWIPKSVTTISAENVSIPEWFYRKNIASIANRNF